jgi:myo-inositol 2-dehydrogenase / D-chiro-inositol 1-dehydrogenase
VSFICRQIPGSVSDVGNVIYGSEGTCHIGAGNSGSKIFDRAGKKVWEMDGSIAAAYTGQKVLWEFLTKESKLDLFPKDLTMDASLPKPEYAIPGKMKLV